MRYTSSKEWENAEHKRVALFGMSGLGKTYISEILCSTNEWFHYSVDYRIGTRYMGEYIVDNFKREAMRNPFLRGLLRSDSIYIGSNISFNNLAPLSTYLGKPGNPDKGGISFEEYIKRQRQHYEAEKFAIIDTAHFIQKAFNIYGYNHFVCDTSGSICEVVDTENPKDEVMAAISEHALPVWIRGDKNHTDLLVERFSIAPKPMYYPEPFLRAKWQEYLDKNDFNEMDVDPDAFAIWGYRELLEHRLPRYEKMAAKWGVTISADEIKDMYCADEFLDLIARSIDRKT